MSDVQVIHVQTHKVKIQSGENQGDWGHAALCDPLLAVEDSQRTSSPEKSNCPGCISKSIKKLKDRISILEEML